MLLPAAHAGGLPAGHATPLAMAAAGGPGGLFGNRHDFLVVNGWARHTPWLHGVMTLYASDGAALFALLLAVGWWIARRSASPGRAAAALWAGIGTVAAVGINQPIVSAVREKRPYASLHHVLVLVARSADHSFPSDHAVMAGAAAAGLLLLSWRLGLIAALAAVVLAFARVYVGAHYPGDVLAGLGVGAAVAVAGYLAAVPLLTRLVRGLAATPLRPLLLAGDRTAAGGPAGASRSPAGKTAR